MDRNYISGMVLIAVVFIAWMFYVSRSAPPAVPKVTQEQVFNDTVSTEIPDTVASKPAPEISAAIDTLIAAADTMPAELISVSTELYEATLSTKGAGLTSFKLRDFNYLDEGDGPVEMIHSDGLAVPNFRFRDNPLHLEDRNFTVDRTNLDLTGTNTGELKFSYTLPGGQTIVKKYKFYADHYKFDIEFDVDGINSLGLKDYYQFYFEPGLEPTEVDVKNDLTSFRANAMMAGDIEKFDSFDKQNVITEDLEGTADWISTRSKYFVAALIPVSRDASGITVSGDREKPNKDAGVRGYTHVGVGLKMRLAQRDNLIDSYTVYLGPLDYNRLSTLGNQLEESMDLGWWLIRPVTKWFTWLMIKVHKVVPNYGFVIIIFAVLVKVIFSPLSYISVKSMRKMQEIQPIINGIKEKHKKDPNKMNQEVMRVYKEYKINPVGGCLPMLPQIPIFFALYTVFRTTIEFRGAPFILWVTDLSRPDPIYILPIFMAVTMFVQQKMTMKDPKQKFMIYVFPAMFLWWGINFPSGLCLYWAITNVFALFEAIFVHKRHLPVQTAQVVIDDKTNGKPRKKK